MIEQNCLVTLTRLHDRIIYQWVYEFTLTKWEDNTKNKWRLTTVSMLLCLCLLYTRFTFNQIKANIIISTIHITGSNLPPKYLRWYFDSVIWNHNEILSVYPTLKYETKQVYHPNIFTHSHWNIKEPKYCKIQPY